MGDVLRGLTELLSIIRAERLQVKLGYYLWGRFLRGLS